MKLRKVIFALLWVLSLVGISYFGGAISYGLFWGLTLIPVISWIYLLFVFVQFRIYQEIESRVIVCKQPMPYFFVLPNETFYSFAGISVRLFSRLSYVTDMPEDQEYELLPGNQYVYHTHMICKYRGEYEVGVKELIITDFFRLFRLRYKISGTIKALVYPRIIHKTELESIRDIINVSSQETPFNQEEPDVVTRDYIAGDALKLIHWKATAREQKLKTRTLQGERRQDLLLLYDTKRYSDDEYIHMPLENQILETVLALGVFFAGKNIPYTVYCGQKGIQRRRVNGMNQFDMLYEETGSVVFDETENLTAMVQQLIAESVLLQTKTLILVAHDPGEELMNLLQMLAMEGVGIVLYLVTDKDAEQYIRQSNSRVKIMVLPVEANLEDIL